MSKTLNYAKIHKKTPRKVKNKFIIKLLKNYTPI